MIIFWRLLLAHLLTDFTFQTNKIALWKRKSIMGVVVHSSIFLVLAIIFCIFTKNFHSISTEYLFSKWWKLPGWLSILMIFLIHFVEDYYRAWSIKKVGSPDNLFFFLWDQFIHIVLLFLFSPQNLEKIIIEKFVVIVILAVVVTHFVSIFIPYLEEAIYGEKDAPWRLKGKYYLIAKRLAIFLCLLLPGMWWALFLSIWLIHILIYPRVTQLSLCNFTRLNIILSNSLAVICGIIGRMIIY